MQARSRRKLVFFGMPWMNWNEMCRLRVQRDRIKFKMIFSYVTSYFLSIIFDTFQCLQFRKKNIKIRPLRDDVVKPGDGCGWRLMKMQIKFKYRWQVSVSTFFFHPYFDHNAFFSPCHHFFYSMMFLRNLIQLISYLTSFAHRKLPLKFSLSRRRWKNLPKGFDTSASLELIIYNFI